MEDFFDDEDTYETITMTDDNGEEKEYFVLDALENGGSKYILAVEASEWDSESDDANALILKETSVDSEDAVYSQIEDENEYKKIVVMFQENNPEQQMDFI